jgi:hypothetical protein
MFVRKSMDEKQVLKVRNSRLREMVDGGEIPKRRGNVKSL